MWDWFRLVLLAWCPYMFVMATASRSRKVGQTYSNGLREQKWSKPSSLISLKLGQSPRSTVCSLFAHSPSLSLSPFFQPQRSVGLFDEHDPIALQTTLAEMQPSKVAWYCFQIDNGPARESYIFAATNQIPINISQFEARTLVAEAVASVYVHVPWSRLWMPR